MPGEIANMSFSGTVGWRQGKDGRGDFANEGVMERLRVWALKGEVGKGYCLKGVAKYSEACKVVYASNGTGFTSHVSMVEAC